MNDNQETTPERDQFVYCPACSATLELCNQFLDPKQGKTIRLFKCERCGERIWDD